MKQLTEFTNNPYQTGRIPLSNISGTASINLYWAPTQSRWYFDIQYDNIICKGIMLCLGPNILRFLKNRIPFGLMVVADDLIEPYQLEDLQTQRVKIFILDKDEVSQFESVVYNE